MKLKKWKCSLGSNSSQTVLGGEEQGKMGGWEKGAVRLSGSWSPTGKPKCNGLFLPYVPAVEHSGLWEHLAGAADRSHADSTLAQSAATKITGMCPNYYTVWPRSKTRKRSEGLSGGSRPLRPGCPSSHTFLENLFFILFRDGYIV